MKKNNKGFALMETLIVSVFVMGIFSIIYVNFFPLMGEYEKRERYDDIDSLYNTYTVKKYMEKKHYFPSSVSNITNSIDSDLRKGLNITKVYFINQYPLSDSIKNQLKALSRDDNYINDYIDSLPNFTKGGSGLAGRIIVEYKHEVNKEGTKKEIIYSFSTIGVKRL